MPQQVWWNYQARFNVAPLQFVPCVRLHAGSSEASLMCWGLKPATSDESTEPSRPASVSCEDVETLPGVREAWHGGRRCILPAAGFYAWRLMPAGHRQPYFVRLLDRAVFGIAGIWDRWSNRDGDVMESCCAVSVAANGFLRRLVPSEAAMPAILRRKDYATWLGGTGRAACAALRPYEPAGMEACPVSPRINSTRVEGRRLIAPVRLAL